MRVRTITGMLSIGLHLAGGAQPAKDSSEEEEARLLTEIASLQAKVEASRRTGNYRWMGKTLPAKNPLNSWSKGREKVTAYFKVELSDDRKVSCRPILLTKGEEDVWAGTLACKAISPAESSQSIPHVYLKLGKEFTVDGGSWVIYRYGQEDEKGGGDGYSSHGFLSRGNSTRLVYGGLFYQFLAKCFYPDSTPDTLWSVALEMELEGPGVGSYAGRKYSRSSPCAVNGRIKSRLDTLNRMLSDIDFVQPPEDYGVKGNEVYRTREICESASGEASVVCPSTKR